MEKTRRLACPKPAIWKKTTRWLMLYDLINVFMIFVTNSTFYMFLWIYKHQNILNYIFYKKFSQKCSSPRSFWNFFLFAPTSTSRSTTTAIFTGLPMSLLSTVVKVYYCWSIATILSKSQLSSRLPSFWLCTLWQLIVDSVSIEKSFSRIIIPLLERILLLLSKLF